MYGWAGKILDIDLSTGTIETRALDMELARMFLGGRGLGARLLWDAVGPGIDPLSPDNVLIFAAGPLTASGSQTSNRFTVSTKSPLTGTVLDANSGGWWGMQFKRTGHDVLIVRGVAERPTLIEITPAGVVLKDASHLWGQIVFETTRALSQDNNKRNVLCVGPAGENLSRMAAIMNDGTRSLARGGPGAVMGSKRLKAIACAGNRRISLHDSEEFKRVTKRQHEFMDESILKIGIEAFGTNMIADMVNVRGGYPTHNWQSGTFEQIENVNGQAMTDQVLVEGVRCFACPVACGRGTEIRQGKWQGAHGEGPEYETTNTLGAMCGVDDLNAITMANYRCNEYGLDTISTGASIAFAMECYQRGILNGDQTGGMAMEFGDADLVVDLVELIGRREGVGDLIAEGTRRMAERL